MNDIAEREMDRLIERAVTLADSVELELLSAHSVTKYLLEKACEEAFAAIALISSVDLTKPGGIAEATRYQNAIARYTDMITWLSQAMRAGEEAMMEAAERFDEHHAAVTGEILALGREDSGNVEGLRS